MDPESEKDQNYQIRDITSEDDGLALPKSKIMKGYGSSEGLKWKRDSDAVINKQVIHQIYENLMTFGFIPPPDSDFLFVSPSAHIATHELQVFRDDALNRSGRGTFLVGDISALPVTPERVHRNVNSSSFQYARMDADYLPVPDNEVDMIWDRKGNIWHKAVEGGERVVRALEKYHTKLKKGGVVVLDSIPFRGKALTGSSEESTITKINNLPNASEVWNRIEEMYDIIKLGEGLTSVYVLQAK